MKISRWIPVLAVLGFILLSVGSYLGLVVAPPERFMGEAAFVL